MLDYMLDENVLTSYFSMIKGLQNDGATSLSALLNPPLYIIENTFDFFMERVEMIAKKRCEERMATTYYPLDAEALEELYCKEENVLYANVTKDALFYMYHHPTAANTEIINYIASHSIEDISKEFRFQGDMYLKIFLEYLRYLVVASTKDLTKNDEIQIMKDHPWIKKLSTHRGFSTLNDLCRIVLEDIFDTLYDDFIDPKIIFKNLDNYFLKNTVDSSTRKFGPSISSLENLLAFKYAQTRLILADVYLYLKATSIYKESEGEEFTESELLSIIEDKIDLEDFTLPSKKADRYKIYGLFFEFLKKSFLRDKYMHILTSNDEIKTLGSINPLYFLDN